MSGPQQNIASHGCLGIQHDIHPNPADLPSLRFVLAEKIEDVQPLEKARFFDMSDPQILVVIAIVGLVIAFLRLVIALVEATRKKGD